MEKSKFLEALDIWGIKYAGDVYKKFEIYTQNLLSYNEKVNLTAITNIDEIYEDSKRRYRALHGRFPI